MTQFLRYFTPSVLRLPEGARAELGEAADLVERAALRRTWQVGTASYQVVAVRVPAGTAPPEFADLLVRRRYTLEPGTVIERGSVVGALRRALSCLTALREPDVLAKLLAEYNARGVNAGMAPANAVIQCFVLAPPAVYAQAEGEVDELRGLRADLDRGGLGFRFLAAHREQEELSVLGAPPPFDALDLVRPVTTIHR